jgi:hypothetical protein
LVGLLAKPFLLRSISNLALQNALFEDPNAANDSTEQLKAELFKAMLDRNKHSHGRPDSNSDTYRYLLENTAAIYADKPLGQDGAFVVSAQDTIKFIAPTQAHSCAAVLASDLLSRSGVVFLDPADTTEMLFRFSPLWLHRYLAEEYNISVAGAGQNRGMPYAGCSNVRE